MNALSHRKLKQGCYLCFLLITLYYVWLTYGKNRTRDTTQPNQSLIKILDLHASSIGRRRLYLVKEYLAQLPTYFDLYDLRSKVNDTGFECTVTKTSPRFPVCVYHPDVDKYISGALLSSGIWEPYLTRVYQIALTRHSNAIVVDIGANIGYYTLLGAAMGHHVLSIEPVWENVRRLHKGVQLGKFIENIHVLKNAVSNQNKNVTLSSNDSNQGGIKVIEDTKKGEVTQTITLDDLLFVMSPSEVIIKIDIEGYECKAMEISKLFFTNNHVLYIFMEWQQMFKQRLKRSACTIPAIYRLTDMLTGRGYIPHEVHTGMQLNPVRSATIWRVGDIYWRHRSLPLLIPSL